MSKMLRISVERVAACVRSLFSYFTVETFVVNSSAEFAQPVATSKLGSRLHFVAHVCANTEEVLEEEVYTRPLPLTSCQEDRLGLDYTVLCLAAYARLWLADLFSVWPHDLGRNIQRESSRVAPMEIRPPGFLAPWLVAGNVVPLLHGWGTCSPKYRSQILQKHKNHKLQNKYHKIRHPCFLKAHVGY